MRSCSFLSCCHQDLRVLCQIVSQFCIRLRVCDSGPPVEIGCNGRRSDFDDFKIAILQLRPQVHRPEMHECLCAIVDWIDDGERIVAKNTANIDDGCTGFRLQTPLLTFRKLP